MLDKPRHDMIEPASTSQLLAGEIFSANQQCELVFGAESKVCSYMVSASDISIQLKLHSNSLKNNNVAATMWSSMVWKR